MAPIPRCAGSLANPGAHVRGEGRCPRLRPAGTAGSGGRGPMGPGPKRRSQDRRSHRGDRRRRPGVRLGNASIQERRNGVPSFVAGSLAPGHTRTRFGSDGRGQVSIRRPDGAHRSSRPPAEDGMARRIRQPGTVRRVQRARRAQGRAKGAREPRRCHLPGVPARCHAGSLVCVCRHPWLPCRGNGGWWRSGTEGYALDPAPGADR